MLSELNNDFAIQEEWLITKNKEKFYFTEEGSEIVVDPDYLATMGSQRNDVNLQDVWNYTERLSIGKDGAILGYFQANIKRPENYVENVLVLNFGKTNYTFSKDFREFWTSFFEVHGFRKIRFYVVVGNPAEKQYDKLVKRYDGRIIGIFKDEILYSDGTYKDMKIYELYKENYDKVIKNRGKD